MKQRILSMILVVVMVFTSVDITAFAQENIGVEVETATEDEEVEEEEEGQQEDGTTAPTEETVGESEEVVEPTAVPEVEPTEEVTATPETEPTQGPEDGAEEPGAMPTEEPTVEVTATPEAETTQEPEEGMAEPSEVPTTISENEEAAVESPSASVMPEMEESVVEEYVQPQLLIEAMERIESVTASASDDISQEAINKLFFEHPEYLKNDDFDEVISETLKYSQEVQKNVDNEKAAAYFEALHQGTSILWSEFWSWFGIGESYQEQHEKEMAKEILQKYSDNNNSLMTSVSEVKEAIGTMSKVYDVTLASERELFAQELKSKNLALSDEKIDDIVKEAFADTEYLSTMKTVANEAIGTFAISMEYIELLELEERAINDLIEICEQSGCEEVEEQIREIKKDRDTDFWTYFSKYYLTEHTIDLLWGELKDWVQDNINVTKFDMKEISSAKKVAELMLEVVSDVYADYNPNADEIIFSAMALSYFNSAEIVVGRYERKFTLAQKGQATITSEDIRMYEAAYSYRLATLQILAKYNWKIAYKQDQSSQLHFDILCAKNAVDKFTYEKYLKSCLKNMEADNIEIPELPEDYDSTESIAAKFEAIRNQYVPNASYWTGSWGGCIQCFGFARMVFSKLFGCEMPAAYYGNRRYELVPNDNVVVIGQLVESNVNSTNVKNLLTQGKLGDVIQANGVYGQHTMVLEGTSDAGVTVYHCNKSGECGVYEDTYSWDTFVSLYGSATNGSDNGVTLYRAYNYATIYGDGTNLFYDDTVNFVIDADGVLTKYNGWQRFVKIPETVTAIGDSAFKNNTSMISVSIPDGVTSIGNSAFYGCSNLLGVYIPDSVKSIGEYAFCLCSEMNYIKIPCNVEYVIIQNHLFFGCSSLKEVYIPDNVKKIGGGAFSKCTSLYRVRIPMELEVIPYEEELTLVGYTERYYEMYPFGAVPITILEFAEGTSCIADYLFWGISFQMENLVLPNTITEIGDYAFAIPTNGMVKKIIFSDNLLSIGEGAFIGWTSLESLDIPKTIDKINYLCFGQCSIEEEALYIPENIKIIEEKAFDESCFKEIIFSNSEIYLKEEAFGSVRVERVIITAGVKTRYGDNVLEFYGYMTDHSPFVGAKIDVIEFDKNIKNIQPGLFAGITVEEINIPDTVTEIGACAFTYCRDLKTIRGSEQIRAIGARAFYECDSLNSIDFLSSVEYIGERAFVGCYSLKNIDSLDHIKEIGGHVFEDCTLLEKVILSEKCMNIPANAFANCISLKEVNIPSNITKIEEYAFANCNSLKEVNIPGNVTIIERYAFYGCGILERVVFPDSVTSIGEYVCADCNLLTSIRLGAGLTTIPQYSFANCESLEDISLSYNITTIDANAFADNVKLTKIIIPRKVSFIDSTAFSYPANMTIYGVAGTYAEIYAEENGITFVNQEIPATAVEVLPENPTVNKGYTTQMTLSITPSNFTDEIVWKSLDTSIATVDQNGLIKGVGVGSTKIKVSVGDVSKQFTITVLQPVTSIYVSPGSASLEAGQEKQLSAEVYPDNASDKSYEWSSADETIATVSETGEVTGISKGTVKIYATAKDGSGKSDYCNVTVTSNLHVVNTVDDFESKHPYDNDCTDVWKYQDDEAKKIVIRFSEETEVEEDFDFIYIYGDNDVQIGKYTGIQLAGKEITVPGTSVRVKLVSDNAGTEYGFKVDEVRPIGAEKPLESITLSEKEISLVKDAEKQLQVNYLPENTTDSRIVTWSSSNEYVATVDDTGLVKAVGAGTAIVQAKVGQKIAKCSVTVTAALEGIEFVVSDIELSVGDKYVVDVCYNPTDTTDNKTLIWSSSNQEVATVNDSGVVRVIGYGETVIEGVSVVNEAFKDTCTISVKQYEVQFDSVGGSQIESVLCGYKQTLDCSEMIPEKENFVFEGWYKDSEYQEPWTSTDIITSNITLYAKWQEVKEGLWIIPVSDQTYTGKAIKPAVKVYDGENLLKVKTDYTVSYKNNKKPNDASKAKTAPTITVTGTGNYKGTETITFKILKKDMSDADITASDITVAYNKKYQKKVPTVKRSGKKLEKDKDFTVSYPDLANNPKAYKAPGTYTILVKGKGGYTGQREVKLTITESKLMSKVTISSIATQPYTGTAVTTATMKKVPTVKYGKKTVLQEGIHYTVKYENNINIGTATMILTGTDTETPEGTFTGTKKVTFKIGGTSLSKAKVTGVPTSMTYTGAEINEHTEGWGNPIKVVLNGEELTCAADENAEGDYIVTFKKNTNKGTATVTVKGINAYSGSVKKEFTIKAYDINDNPGDNASDNTKKNLVTETMETKTVYAKGGSKPEPVVMFGETTLIKGTDYTLEYKNHTKWNDGSDPDKLPTVTITGKGNFKGSVKLTYTIDKQDIGNMKITVPDVVYKKKKGAYKSTPVIKDLNNKTLKVKTDYSNVYTYTYGQDVTLKNGTERKEGEKVGANDIVPADTLIRITVTGKGNYTGDTPLVGEYRVVKSSIAKAKVTVPSQPYTGKSITIEDKTKIKVKIGSDKLEPEEFEIVDGSYKNNTKAGTASFTIKGVGNYGGTKKVTFKIKPKGFVWWWRNLFE